METPNDPSQYLKRVQDEEGLGKHKVVEVDMSAAEQRVLEQFTGQTDPEPMTQFHNDRFDGALESNLKAGAQFVGGAPDPYPHLDPRIQQLRVETKIEVSFKRAVGEGVYPDLEGWAEITYLNGVPTNIEFLSANVHPVFVARVIVIAQQNAGLDLHMPRQR